MMVLQKELMEYIKLIMAMVKREKASGGSESSNYSGCLDALGWQSHRGELVVRNLTSAVVAFKVRPLCILAVSGFMMRGRLHNGLLRLHRWSRCSENDDWNKMDWLEMRSKLKIHRLHWRSYC